MAGEIQRDVGHHALLFRWKVDLFARVIPGDRAVAVQKKYRLKIQEDHYVPLSICKFGGYGEDLGVRTNKVWVKPSAGYKEVATNEFGSK
ncbi:hypothetical protein R6Q59_034044 [Mikania micrantha]